MSWRDARPAVQTALDPTVVLLQDGWQLAVQQALDRGVRVFVAAGGDGTVGTLVNALASARRRPPLNELMLGAVGLGSTNDYHRPHRRRVGAVPLKVDASAPRRRDLCRARFRCEHGGWQERVFLISASVGACAEANARFNRRGLVLDWLKRNWVSGALIYVAVSTILRHRATRAELRVADERLTVSLDSLNILKSATVSGSFTVDTLAGCDDALLGVHLCSARGRWGLLCAFVDLFRGRFQGRRGRRYWHAAEASIRTSSPICVEFDGEVFKAVEVEFSVLDEWISECQ